MKRDLKKFFIFKYQKTTLFLFSEIFIQTVIIHSQIESYLKKKQFDVPRKTCFKQVK
jgi:hypothetical protein